MTHLATDLINQRQATINKINNLDNKQQSDITLLSQSGGLKRETVSIETGLT